MFVISMQCRDIMIISKWHENREVDGVKSKTRYRAVPPTFTADFLSTRTLGRSLRAVIALVEGPIDAHDRRGSNTHRCLHTRCVQFLLRRRFRIKDSKMTILQILVFKD